MIDHGLIDDLPREDLVFMIYQAVRENERLLRACHLQRDRARRAEDRASRGEFYIPEASTQIWEAVFPEERKQTSVVTAVDRNAGTLARSVVEKEEVLNGQG